MAEEEERYPKEYEEIEYVCVRCGTRMTLMDMEEERSIMTGAVQCTNCDYPMLYKKRKGIRVLKAI